MPKIIAKIKEASCLVTRYEKIKTHCRIHVNSEFIQQKLRTAAHYYGSLAAKVT